jgi:hypothetical protein
MANNKSFKIKNGLLAGRYLQSNGTVTSGSVGYYLSNASYDSVSFSFASQDTAPRFHFFKPDGITLFMVGSADSVFQYTLSTAWDVSTASYASKSFSATSQDTDLYGLFFKPDGTKMYLAGNSGNSIYQYSLSTAWDVSTASYDSVSFSVASQGTFPSGLSFSDDGTKMYVSDSLDFISQYTLSTAWDLSTASYASKSFSTVGIDTNPYQTVFVGSGTRMFFIGTEFDKVYETTLSTAWDISTATLTGNTLDVSTETANTPFGLSFSSDGSKMHITAGSTVDSILQYSTVSYTQTLDLSTGTSFSFTPSGATTVSFTNPPASGLAIGFAVEINGDGSAITWPDSVKWPSGTAPTATASKEVYTFITVDGGTTYYGKLAGSNIA